MSDKTIGIIGQKYEDRKTGKCGVLESRDEKFKTLVFKADDGTTFSISNSSFRSNWRKVKEEAVDTEPVDTEPVADEIEESVQEEAESDTPEETTEPEEVESNTDESESNVTPMPKKKSRAKKESDSKKESVKRKAVKEYDGLSDEQAIDKFVEDISATRKVEVVKEDNGFTIIADDVVIATVTNNSDKTFHIAMLPDLFTFVDWKGKVVTSSIEYKTGAENYLGVVLDTKETCVPELLNMIKETVMDINVYGYTVEDDTEETAESEENTNEEN